MSENDRTFTAEEVRALIYYALSVFSEMNDNLLNTVGDRERYETGFRRLLRKYARLLMFPELVLSEQPRTEVKPRVGGMTAEDREYWYDFLGNRSRGMMSLDDMELIAEIHRRARVSYSTSAFVYSLRLVGG
jgi:hypothetical protein